MQSCPKDIWHSAALKRLEECGGSLFLSDDYDLVESLYHRIWRAESIYKRNYVVLWDVS